VVTVLFADLVGFTARAEALDPEDVRALLSPYYARLRSELERFGGTVEKFIGDAVMALFGAPLAHEDDPERAVRAALAIRDWVAEEGGLHVRIAVNTGEALISLGARPSEGEGMASGDVVNTTARLQSAAPVDGILVGEQTFRATERAIEYRESEPVTAKGKAEPVRVWEAMQPRSRFGVDLAERSRAQLVGRTQELDLVLAALKRVRTERAPQLVTLVGEPGIGKSRLVAELFAAIGQGGELIAWRQGRSLPYGEGVSYWALGEMLKAQAGILETDSPEASGEKLREAVGRVLPEPSDAGWVESHLRPLAGLGGEDSAGDRRGEAFAAWRRFFEALAEQRPLVLVFEDLHWADDGLLDFVDHLVDWASGVPLLVVATARPDLLARRSGWGGGKANAVTVSLAPLSDEETARLVHALLDQAVLPAELQQQLLQRAGGNPLYAEEFVRMLVERGSGGELRLPETVQGVIAARLDGLSADEKALLQHAAVLGKVFWSGALMAMVGRERFVVEQSLHALERKEFVRRERRTSVVGETEYAFRHLLVRDVAYGQIPRAARTERHRQAAGWIESLGRTEDHAEMLAHHYLAALELARASGQDARELAAPARLALSDAGDRALALNSAAAAASYYSDALALSLAGDPERPWLLFRRAQSLHIVGAEERAEALEEASRALLEAGHTDGAAEAEALLAESWWHRGRRDRTTLHLEQARTLVEASEPSAAKARVLATISRYAAVADNRETAVEVGLEALAIADQLGLDELRASLLISIGTSRGDEQEIVRGIEIALARNSTEAARGYNNLGAMLSRRGELDRAREFWRQSGRVAERLGHAALARYARGILVFVEFTAGNWDECVRVADAFIAACKEGSPHYLEAHSRRNRARVRLARGDEEGALDDVRAALPLAREAGDAQVLQPVLGICAAVHYALGRFDEAGALLDELLAGGSVQTLYDVELAWLAEPLGRTAEIRAFIEEPNETLWSVAALAVLDGEFERAAELFGKIGSVPDEAYARLRAAEQLVTQGRRAEANAQLTNALAFYRSVGATRYIREGEALLAATA